MTMQNFGQTIRRPEIQARIADFQNRFGGGMPPAQPPARTTGGLRAQGTAPTERTGRDIMAERRRQLAAAYQSQNGPAAAMPQERGFAPQARPDIMARVAQWNARANTPAALNSPVADNPNYMPPSGLQVPAAGLDWARSQGSINAPVAGMYGLPGPVLPPMTEPRPQIPATGMDWGAVQRGITPPVYPGFNLRP